MTTQQHQLQRGSVVFFFLSLLLGFVQAQGDYAGYRRCCMITTELMLMFLLISLCMCMYACRPFHTSLETHFCFLSALCLLCFATLVSTMIHPRTTCRSTRPSSKPRSVTARKSVLPSFDRFWSRTGLSRLPTT